MRIDDLPEEVRESARRVAEIISRVGPVLHREDSVSQMAILSFLVASWVASHRDGEAERGDNPTRVGVENRNALMAVFREKVMQMVPGMMVDSDRLRETQNG
jgi:hypothetical protein